MSTGTGPARSRLVGSNAGRTRAAVNDSPLDAEGNDVKRKRNDAEQLEVEPAADEPRDSEDAQAVARLLCLRQLEARSRTRVELSRYLARKGVAESAAVAVLDRLTDVGLIDDSALAVSFAASRQSYQGLARPAIAAKLRLRGVDDQTIADAVGTVDTAVELETAYRLAAKKLPSLERLEPDVRLRRLVGMLGRKGYSSGTAYRVARDVIETTDHPVDGVGNGRSKR